MTTTVQDIIAGVEVLTTIPEGFGGGGGETKMTVLVGKSGAMSIMNALDAAGFVIVSKEALKAGSDGYGYHHPSTASSVVDCRNPSRLGKLDPPAWAPASTESLLPNKAHVGAPASGPEQNHFIWFWRAALHAGGANWHAGHRKSGRIRLLGKKTLQCGGRNVPFNNIARNFRRMAGREIVRDAEPCLHRIEVFRLQDLGRKSGFLQVLHPAQTAAAIRVPVNRYDRLRRGRQRFKWQHRDRTRDKHTPAR